jgi:hypothetical protein
MTDTVKPAAKAKIASKPAAKPEPKKVVIKAGAPRKAVPAAASDKAPKAVKPKKQKMVRDSFTMPQNDYAHIAALKERCLKAGLSAKKSEVLRAALVCFSKLSDKDLIKAISDLEKIKTGRPSKA